MLYTCNIFYHMATKYILMLLSILKKIFYLDVFIIEPVELLIEPTEAQTKLVEKLSKNLFTTNSFKKIEEEEELVHFDVTSAPRVIVHQGKLLKKSMYRIYVFTVLQTICSRVIHCFVLFIYWQYLAFCQLN